jgi:hypothetical protein
MGNGEPQEEITAFIQGSLSLRSNSSPKKKIPRMAVPSLALETDVEVIHTYYRGEHMTPNFQWILLLPSSNPVVGALEL